MRSFGVDEELLLVDPDSGAPIALAESVTSGDTDTTPEAELKREQIETGTTPCTTLTELAGELRSRRRAAAEAAERNGSRAVALATSPIAVTPSVTPGDRYERMTELYALTAQEQLTCGCHVHVSTSSEEESVAVLDRIRVWLPPLLAMTGNSPYWQDADSGYASYRHLVWGRWPSSGPTDVFGTPKTYHETVRNMIDSGALLDEGMVYFDARLSRTYPTVEIRVADVCLVVDDALLLAALVRGLVDTAAQEWRDGEPPPAVRTELLRLASWRAARSGLEDDLINPLTGRPEPAASVVHALLEHVGPALESNGDDVAAAELTGRLLSRGNGAALQRRAYRDTGDLSGVVRDAVARTVRS